ncbi:DamX protein [Candidatus Photodesmus katoptron]|uniref:SPOR domain-containing protein n=1 Tax=Candidatus Photodesmus anomalopis TaxID=28176 RepID=UPI0004D7998D|nr:SPOR domain-containing protein [Candidatus Photodesmus katoptron]KEY90718.1 DamX protein [Candidatus Photodesmus katoptron]
MFAKVNSIECLLPYLNCDQENKPIELEVDAFFQDEADCFFKLFVVPFIKKDMKKEVLEAYKNIKLFPGYIIDLKHFKMVNQKVVPHLVILSSKVIVLFLLIFSVIYWSLNEFKYENVLVSLEKQNGMIFSYFFDIFLKDRINIKNASDVNHIDSARQVEIIQEVENKQTIYYEKNIILPIFSSELKAFLPSSYTLQLAALNSVFKVQKFIKQYNLQGKVRVYSTVRNGIRWYIITYENYPTIQMARDAAEILPNTLKILRPWAKSMTQVHKEIDFPK